MKQKEIINQIRTNIERFKNIDGALLIGSFGRNNPTYNSDIDISILANKQFKIELFLPEIELLFRNKIKHILRSELRRKYVIYFTDSPKLEFNICFKLDELDMYFLGSEIYNIDECILIDSKDELKRHLNRIIKEKKAKLVDVTQLFSNTIDKFLYDFENLFHHHKRSEAYKCYFQYNLALNDCMQLLQISNQSIEYLYLPNIQKFFFGKEGRDKLKSLNGSLYLPEVNKQKRNLLNFFYEILNNQKFIKNNKIEEIITFCEWIFAKDYGYNFRDISDNCSKLKSGLIYRTSTLTRYQNDEYFEKILKKHSINKIIDLRADREIKKDSYMASINNVSFVWAPFDPWNQSEHFINNHKQGSDSEIAYRFFAIECKESIKIAAKEIINQKTKAIAIHCHAGKDRTGCLIALFYLLVGASEQELFTDYYDSESDTKEYKIKTFLKEVQQYPNIEAYFKSCGLSDREIEKLKLKLSA
ncbi:MAG: tyrosine-protein phosphatase [Bacteroidetes bacterium]|nr:tyrosine-protein phosphatase [Bacteroidota bacterium]